MRRAASTCGAPSPVDVIVGDIRLRCDLRDNTRERKFVFTPGASTARIERWPRHCRLMVFVDVGERASTAHGGC
jgi:hypothetical protein